ncbi:hypothetical protein BCR44DRAFT_245282 [Catenaria anguillulae PL171]|uniref:Uncharacterized protein n=1 Tax=Catenaria anguillulae PL171 TaxID=765915 RepID=A0A1Y2HQE1_9FUNG|nr:hypothetical protein BCR44DRAFT_245282 [Catenaria anguillulae PL171]
MLNLDDLCPRSLSFHHPALPTQRLLRPVRTASSLVSAIAKHHPTSSPSTVIHRRRLLSAQSACSNFHHLPWAGWFTCQSKEPRCRRRLPRSSTSVLTCSHPASPHPNRISVCPYLPNTVSPIFKGPPPSSTHPHFQSLLGLPISTHHCLRLDSARNQATLTANSFNIMHSHFVQSPAGPHGTGSQSPCTSPTQTNAAEPPNAGRIPSPAPTKPTLTLSPTRYPPCAPSSTSGFFSLPPAVQSQILAHCSIQHLASQVVPVSQAMRATVNHYFGRWLLASPAHQLQGSLIVSALGSGHAATAPPVGTIQLSVATVCANRGLVAFTAPALHATVPAAPGRTSSFESHVASITVDPAETSVWWSLKLDLSPASASLSSSPSAAIVDRYKLVDYSQTGPYSSSPIDMHNGAYMIQTPRMVHVPGRGAFSVTVRESPTGDASRLLHVDMSAVVVPLSHAVHMFANAMARTWRHVRHQAVDELSVVQPATRTSLASTSSWTIRHQDTQGHATAQFVGKYTTTLDRVLALPAHSPRTGFAPTSPVLPPADAPPMWRPYAPAAVPASVTPPMPSSPLALTAPAMNAVGNWPSSALAMSASYQMMSPPTPAAASCGMVASSGTGVGVGAAPSGSAQAVRGSRAWAMSALRGWHKLSISDSQRLHSASHM